MLPAQFSNVKAVEMPPAYPGNGRFIKGLAGWPRRSIAPLPGRRAIARCEQHATVPFQRRAVRLNSDSMAKINSGNRIAKSER
jgi:hypothetical protein